MISDSGEVDGSRDEASPAGCAAVDAGVRDDGAGKPETPVDDAALPSSRAPAGICRPQSVLPENLLNSLSAQFRTLRSMDGLYTETGKRGNAISLLNGDVLERKVTQVIDRVRNRSYSEEICQDLRKHFSRLPPRYTLNIDVQRHEDVLLHMNLLGDAWRGEASSTDNSSDNSSDSAYALPQLHVRKVQLVSETSWCDSSGKGGDGLMDDTSSPKIAMPTFGSSTNLVGLLVGNSKVQPLPNTPILTLPQCTPSLSTRAQAPPSGPESILRPTFAPSINPLETDDDCGQEDSYGYEITLATSDRRGLLKFFTDAFSNTPLQLDIREAHVFSTSDGMALEVFVVEGWTGPEAEVLKQEVLEVLSNQLNPQLSLEAGMDVQLRTAVENLSFEDWTVEYKNLHIGERLGGGSSGRLYKGKYLGQEVAIKVIELDSVNLENETGTFRSVELLQMFKQEISIMRLVRHRNLLQFIGACTCWPKLFIVTELMEGGSIRDVMQKRGSGLDLPAALKVLRDVAKGMDFLHQRGVIHRDLKAANLLIEEHDVVKICDFGVARVRPAVPSNFALVNWAAEMTAEIGTYRWMAPEVLEHKAYGHKADVYSFGIMIWEVLTGGVPYGDMTPLQAAIGVVQRELRPKMPSDVPPKLADFAGGCWHQDPERRPDFSEATIVLEEMMKTMSEATPFWKKKPGSFSTR